jgi:uncharacterized protein YjiS (DUF1127 family)
MSWILHKIAAWRRYHKALAQLQALPDELLYDIGIARCDIERVAKLELRR